MKGNRIIIGIGIAAVFVAAVLLRQFSPLIGDMIFLIAITIGGIEMSQALGNRFAKPIIGFVASFPVVSLIAFLGGTYLAKTVVYLNGLMMFLITDVVYLGAIAIFTAISKKHTKENMLTTMLAVVYPMTLIAFCYGLNHFGVITGAFEPITDELFYGATPIALLFSISALSDTMAFCMGKLFKGPKLAPKISPNKTVSGAIGGLIGGVMGAAAVMGISTANWMGILSLPFVTNAGTFVIHMLIMGILGSVFTQAGDLVASYVKREVAIKDYGKLLGKHGGIMDRIDGQLFAGFFLFVYLTIMSLV